MRIKKEKLPLPISSMITVTKSVSSLPAGNKKAPPESDASKRFELSSAFYRLSPSFSLYHNTVHQILKNPMADGCHGLIC